MNDSSPKTITFGQALCGNVVSPFVAGYLYYTGTPLKIVLISSAVAVIVLNIYFVVAFKVWGQNSN
jgi:hypothetical protein